MASSSSSKAAEDESGRKRKRGAAGFEPEATQQSSSKWGTRREHEIYSTKLLDALRLVRAGGGGGGGGGRDVRDAAYRALAVAARGRSRWSRAILARRRRQHGLRVQSPAPASAAPPPDVSSCSAGLRAPVLARKVKALGRLVPGCRKLPFPALLSEASDYIAALQMQVRAMAALAQAISSSSPPSLA